MTWPSQVVLSYCAACRAPIQTGGLCSFGCAQDCETGMRPVVHVTYIWSADYETVEDVAGHHPPRAVAPVPVDDHHREREDRHL